MKNHPRMDDLILSVCTPNIDRINSQEHLMTKYKSCGCLQAKALLEVYYMNTFVKKLAKKIGAKLPKSIDIRDLEQSAYFGLVDCIEKFNPDRNIKFEGFARLRIEGAMKDFLRKEDPVSRLSRQRSKIIQKCINQFISENGRPPTNSELMNKLGIEQDEFCAIIKDQKIPHTISIFSANANNDNSDNLEMLASSKTYDFKHIDETDTREWLLEKLCNADKLIITLYFFEKLTMLEVGKVVGYSESRVSQRIKHVLKILHLKLNERPEMISLMAS